MRLAGTDLNLDLELSLSPVIQELVRTQVCLPNLKLLVHRIAVVTLPEVDDVDGNEAFKLTLTDGRCSRSDSECKYAHHATGTVAYPPPTVVASAPNINATPRLNSGIDSPEVQPAAASPALGGKSLTCFFWARNGHCIRSDAECRYAHYNTGTVAHNPSSSFTSEPAQYKLNTSLTSTAVLPIARVFATASVPSSGSTAAPAAASLSINEAPAPAPAPTTNETSTSTSTDTTNAIPTTNDAGPGKPSFPSVKHLTCYFWANYGRCKRSDGECNYAHSHTGRVASNPMEFRKMKRL